MEDFAEMAGIELLVIDADTNIREFKDKLNSNEVYYHLFSNKL
jgi:L-arabinose isomerase